MATTGAALLAGTLLLVAACGGGDKGAASDTTGMASPPPAAEPSTPAPSGTDTGAAKSAAGGGGSAAQIAEGDKIFHGQEAGGTCTACHGQDAKGTQMAPDLTDSQWLNGDGSLAFIEHTVTTGVPQPKQHPAPMPPMGGASLSPDQVKAVAAYVYSLSHKS
jgi:mono/diheme cytochrome c family protein